MLLFLAYALPDPEREDVMNSVEYPNRLFSYHYVSTDSEEEILFSLNGGGFREGKQGAVARRLGINQASDI